MLRLVPRGRIVATLYVRGLLFASMAKASTCQTDEVYCCSLARMPSMSMLKALMLRRCQLECRDGPRCGGVGHAVGQDIWAP